MISPTEITALASIVVKLSGDVIAQKLDDESVLLDLKSGEYFGINPTGSQIWQQLHNGESLVDVVQFLSNSFDLPQEMAMADVMSFVNRLAEIGLVEFAKDSE